MSLQIVTANRPVMVKPATRTSSIAIPEEASAKAAAFDTHYAYFDTRTFDAGKIGHNPSFQIVSIAL
jgi:hypothetical protein